MKLLFAHDHIFYKYNDQFYSSGGLSKEMLERYTAVFDEVTIISRQKHIKKYNDKLTLASTNRVNFVEVPNFKSLKSLHKIIKAKKIINGQIQSCDALIARIPSSIGEMAINSANNLSKQYLVEVVACTWDAHWNHSVKGKIVAPFSYFKTKKLVKNAGLVVYVTNEFLQKRYPTKGKSVNCSNVALKEFNDEIIANRIAKIDRMCDEHKLILGTIAAVNVRYKGQQYIIEALGKLRKQGITNIEYRLVGGGDQSFLKHIANKNNVIDQVIFLGSMPHDKVFNWLESVDIYVQPSRQEGLPRALIEAMSCGLPSFGANTAGIPELLDSKYIFSNNKSNIEEICKILRSFNQETMKNQAVRNYSEAKKYDKTIIEARRNKIFNELRYPTF
jgi:glycosyltransferase involved in cell wall biosynthesis